MRTRNCVVCGAPFEIIPHGTNKLYCSEACRKAAHKKAAKARREAKKPPSKTDFLTVRECRLCRTCRYRNRTDGVGLVTCDYILERGEPRGCDVSETCERYERRGKA